MFCYILIWSSRFSRLIWQNPLHLFFFQTSQGRSGRGLYIIWSSRLLQADLTESATSCYHPDFSRQTWQSALNHVIIKTSPYQPDRVLYIIWSSRLPQIDLAESSKSCDLPDFWRPIWQNPRTLHHIITQTRSNTAQRSPLHNVIFQIDLTESSTSCDLLDLSRSRSIWQSPQHHVILQTSPNRSDRGPCIMWFSRPPQNSDRTLSIMLSSRTLQTSPERSESFTSYDRLDFSRPKWQRPLNHRSCYDLARIFVRISS